MAVLAARDACPAAQQQWMLYSAEGIHCVNVCAVKLTVNQLFETKRRGFTCVFGR